MVRLGRATARCVRRGEKLVLGHRALRWPPGPRRKRPLQEAHLQRRSLREAAPRPAPPRCDNGEVDREQPPTTSARPGMQELEPACWEPGSLQRPAIAGGGAAPAHPHQACALCDAQR